MIKTLIAGARLSLACIIGGLPVNCCLAQGSVSFTYSAGDIPTSYPSFDSSCNGSSIFLNVPLPAGTNYPVTSIDVSYSMTSAGSGWMSDQRSQVKCVNTGNTESNIYSGSGNAAGIFMYNRTGLSIANAVYPGGTILKFELHAWRIFEGTPGCNTTTAKVNNNTWTITVNFGAQVAVPKAGINTSSPMATLDVNGRIRLGDDPTLPQAGTLRWNPATNDFEGYNGSVWLSLTRSSANSQWGSVNSNIENFSTSNSSPLPGGQLGWSVGIHGDWIAAGAPGANGTGLVFSFIRNGNIWEQAAQIFAGDAVSGDGFGYSTDIYGTYVIAGANTKQVGANAGQGKAYIQTRTGVSQTPLIAADGAAGDNFGFAVSITDEYAFVGAPLKNISANPGRGCVYVYRRVGTTWSFHTTLTASNGATNNYFGSSISADSNYVIIGASGRNAAYIFSRSGTVWSEQSILTASDGNSNNFGISVSMTNDYAVAGTFSSGAYLYKRNGSTWIQQSTIYPAGIISTDNFGYRVALSGDYLIVTAYKTDMGAIDIGSAYVFHRDGNDWVQQIILRPADGTTNQQFGWYAAIDGDYSVIGSPNKQVGTVNNAGKIYIYKRQ